MPKLTESEKRSRQIRSALAARGLTVRDAARAYRRAGGRAHDSLVYRVVAGQRRSRAIEAFIARLAGVQHKDLWHA